MKKKDKKGIVLLVLTGLFSLGIGITEYLGIEHEVRKQLKEHE